MANKDKYLLKLKELVLDFLKDEKVKVILFGSRARGDNVGFSDVDIGIIPYGDFDDIRLTLLREKVENLNIPYNVEIVNFSEVSPDFRNEALKEIIAWKD
jgi:hypothetical protein